MRIQETWITLLVLAALSILGGEAYARVYDDDDDDAHLRVVRADSTVQGEFVPGVLALRAQNNTTIESNDKTTLLKEGESKGTEMKKKLTTVSDLKPKEEIKYQKAKDIKNEEKLMKNLVSTTSEPSVFLPTVRRPENATNVETIPPVLLLHGEPMPIGRIFNTTTTTSTTVKAIEDDDTAGRARALNITAPDEPTNSLHANLTDLSDVSMDDEDKEVEGGEYVSAQNETLPTIQSAVMTCTEGNKTYKIGEKIVRGCEETCICGEGGVAKDCKPRCSGPYVRAGRGPKDPLCGEQHIDPDGCCAVIVCSDSAVEPEETCVFGNKTLTRGQRVEDGCSQVCACEAGGHLKCSPRCRPNDTDSGSNQHDRCVALTDPRDSCCTITLCDVSLGEHEIKSENAADLTVNLADVKVLNSTAIKVKFSSELPAGAAVEISENSHVWSQQKPDEDGIISNLEPAHSYYVRITEGSRTGSAIRVILPAEVTKLNVTEKSDKNMCNHRGKLYEIGAEWYDECISFCMCGDGAKTECVTIECPTDFGLDVLDPHCLDWETVPANFVPKAPQCCPQEVRCRNNGSCDYEGKTYDNWSEIPSNVTGCEKRCYCEMGNVNCQAACPPVPALPPPTLQCPSNQAILANFPGDECCSRWVCDTTAHSISGMNVTSSTNHQLVNESKFVSNNKSAVSVASQNISAFNEKTKENAYGQATVGYNGPYNPDYQSTESSVEEIFGLPSRSPDKMAPPLKDKSKSKSETKKPIDMMKPHKEVIEQQSSTTTERFPGPLAPNRFPSPALAPTRPTSKLNLPSTNPNKLPPQPEKGLGLDQPQFVPLNRPNKQPEYTFSPSNGENIPPSRFDPSQFDNSNAGPPYVSAVGSKKKVPPVDNGTGGPDDFKGKPGKGKPGQRKPEQDILPDDLLHLINLHHPGLTQLDHPPAAGHPGLYEFHQQISNQEEPPVNQLQPTYFGQGQKKPHPQIVAHKDENGQTTYHIHTPEIPNSPQQIEELLAHISQHDSNQGPFQHYPNQPALAHNYQNAQPPPPPPPRIGPTHLNHPFPVQTPSQTGGFPAGFPIHSFPGYSDQVGQSSSDEIVIKALDALDERTVRLIFTVPSILVGLHGRVELRYTSDKNNPDPSTWKSQIFIPPNDLIATPQLEFELDGLEPATEYKVRVTVNLKDIANSPSSRIYSVRTLDRQEESTTLPPQIPIDAELRVMETNSTWVNVIWKKFTEHEMLFIDGVQLRYKEHDGKVYAATPLIHRAVTSYIIEDLKPGTPYEIGISIIPFPGQTTELISDKTVQVVTAVEPDPYFFDVKVEIKNVKSQDVEISWNGVPYPEDKYVNIYRAIYQSDSGKEDTSTFKIAKRDSPAKTIISDLKPGTRYRLWLEVYLTNGRIKKSNVQDFVTKPGIPLAVGVSQQGKLASIPLHDGDYYGPLVIVAIVASLSILSTLILLMMLMKRRSSSKADISPRKTTSAYDNPSYKTCEDTVTIENGRNKITEHEMSTINSNGMNEKGNV